MNSLGCKRPRGLFSEFLRVVSCVEADNNTGGGNLFFDEVVSKAGRCCSDSVDIDPISPQTHHPSNPACAK